MSQRVRVADAFEGAHTMGVSLTRRVLKKKKVRAKESFQAILPSLCEHANGSSGFPEGDVCVRAPSVCAVVPGVFPMLLSFSSD